MAAGFRRSHCLVRGDAPFMLLPALLSLGGRISVFLGGILNFAEATRPGRFSSRIVSRLLRTWTLFVSEDLLLQMNWHSGLQLANRVRCPHLIAPFAHSGLGRNPGHVAPTIGHRSLQRLTPQRPDHSGRLQEA